MDQLKEILVTVSKHSFWIVCVIILAGSSWFWYSGFTQLDAENAKNKSAIEASFSTVSAIAAKMPTHPNEISHEEMNKRIEQGQQEVLQAWDTLYQRQKAILVWPEEELREDFVKEFRGKVPIESYFSFPIPDNEELASTLRSRYARYIANVLPSIAEIGGTKWLAKTGAGSNLPNNRMRGINTLNNTGLEDKPLVTWSRQNQSTVLSDLFPWQKRGDPPSSLEIYYSQENLWILRQLMELVAQINGAAKQPYQAKIREINRLAIGKSVDLSDVGDILEPGMVGRGLAGANAGPGMEDMAMMAAMMGGAGMGAGSSRSRKKGRDPSENRYVDEALKSISGAQLRTAITSDNPKDVALAVAKRVPVMMSLKMDQRAIPELLSACGSAKLMVEVAQVRVLPKDASRATSSGGMGMQSGMSAEMESMMSAESSMMGMGMGGGSAAMAKAKPLDEFPLDMTVEIYGIIYIYNPAEEKKLGMDEVTDETVDEVVAKVAGEASEARQNEGSSINDVLPKPNAGAPTAGGEGETASPEAATPPDASPDADPATEAAPAGAPVTSIQPKTTPPAIAAGL